MIARRLFARSASVLPRSSSWTCPTCIRQTPAVLHQQRRNISIPQFNLARAFETEGIGRRVGDEKQKFLTREQYHIAWTQYQTMLVERLNELVAGDIMESLSVKEILTQTARDPMTASIFNYASMAHNNHFYFESLSSDPRGLNQYSNLQGALEKQFGTIETLRATMLDTAASMFGPGFVWLVYCPDYQATPLSTAGAFRILTTYIAGTPYPEAGYRQQGIDMNTNNEGSLGEYQSMQPANTVGSFGNFSESGKKNSKLPPGSTTVIPVLCVSTWEHIYLRDYGPTGKMLYLQNWWHNIEWSVVNGRCPSLSHMNSNYRSGPRLYSS